MLVGHHLIGSTLVSRTIDSLKAEWISLPANYAPNNFSNSNISFYRVEGTCRADGRNVEFILFAATDPTRKIILFGDFFHGFAIRNNELLGFNVSVNSLEIRKGIGVARHGALSEIERNESLADYLSNLTFYEKTHRHLIDLEQLLGNSLDKTKRAAWDGRAAGLPQEILFDGVFLRISFVHYSNNNFTLWLDESLNPVRFLINGSESRIYDSGVVDIEASSAKISWGGPKKEDLKSGNRNHAIIIRNGSYTSGRIFDSEGHPKPVYVTMVIDEESGEVITRWNKWNAFWRSDLVKHGQRILMLGRSGQQGELYILTASHRIDLSSPVEKQVKAIEKELIQNIDNNSHPKAICIDIAKLINLSKSELDEGNFGIRINRIDWQNENNLKLELYVNRFQPDSSSEAIWLTLDNNYQVVDANYALIEGQLKPLNAKEPSPLNLNNISRYKD